MLNKASQLGRTLALATVVSGCIVDPKPVSEGEADASVATLMDAATSTADAMSQIMDGGAGDTALVDAGEEPHQDASFPRDAGQLSCDALPACPPIFAQLRDADRETLVSRYHFAPDGVVSRQYPEAQGGELVTVCQIDPPELPEGACLKPLCDPLPGRLSRDEPIVFPAGSALGRDVNPFVYEIWYGRPELRLDYVHENIYDNTPPCEDGQEPLLGFDPDGFQYLTCDPLLDCQPGDQLDTCLPMDFCDVDESPLSCHYYGGYVIQSQDDCRAILGGTIVGFQYLGVDIAPLFNDGFNCIDLPSGSNEYHVAGLRVHCLPMPQCAPGERPEATAQDMPLACNRGGGGGPVFEWTGRLNVPNCYPLRACAEDERPDEPFYGP
ncbi:hypothetical protein CO046_02540 [Candidatus Peregrinibacteria bacterium CG_4_9_14_0_2_um_filter_53_11]|nr:MAG: hypothetical protein CO046_02540 [Candidatus Peregrinibacteria bacterium CG_4_9_14_0_2_um_filter_53_11]